MSEPPTPNPLHATTVAIGGHGVLLLGASGSGKSDLALRLIDRGAELVSDDYTLISREGDALVTMAPATIAGRIEVRGVGIVPLPHRASARVALAVRLDAVPDRMPEMRHETFQGVGLPVLALDPREPSAPIKLEIALGIVLRRATETI